MRTLSEIIEAAKSGQETDSEELLYTVLALDALLTFSSGELMKLAEVENAGRKPNELETAMFLYSEDFKRIRRALKKPPKEWVGWNNDPKNPEYLERRSFAIRLFEKLAVKA